MHMILQILKQNYAIFFIYDLHNIFEINHIIKNKISKELITEVVDLLYLNIMK
jgi:hypothetical protein